MGWTGAVRVGAALELPIGRFGRELAEAVAAIDQVHADGALPRLPVRVQTPINPAADGESHWDGPTNSWIAVRPGTRHPGATLLHEVGHFLDHLGQGDRRGLSSELGDPVFAAWRMAVETTRSYRALASIVATGRAKLIAASGREVAAPGPADFATYLLLPDELWARSYAQFVATRDGSPTLVAGIDAGRGRRPGRLYVPLQWEDDDFAPVATEIGTLFRSLGWIT